MVILGAILFALLGLWIISLFSYRVRALRVYLWFRITRFMRDAR